MHTPEKDRERERWGGGRRKWKKEERARGREKERKRDREGGREKQEEGEVGMKDSCFGWGRVWMGERGVRGPGKDGGQALEKEWADRQGLWFNCVK